MHKNHWECSTSHDHLWWLFLANQPLDLQMGTILPFVASCLGPGTKVLFLMCACCLNLLWIAVSTSGAGKSQSRKQFISEPLEYIPFNGRVQIPDFEISKFTTAGMSNGHSWTSSFNSLDSIVSIMNYVSIHQALRISWPWQMAMA